MALSATPAKIILFPGNTQVIELLGLQDAIALTYLNAATINATLLDDQGNEVPGCEDILFTYQPGTNGNYNATFGNISFNPVVGTGYTLVIDGNQSGGYIHLELLVEVQARQS